MRFENQRESSHIDDRRGGGGGGMSSGGNPLGGMRLPMGKGGMGIGGLLLLLVVGYFAGINPLQILAGGGGGGGGGLGGVLGGMLGVQPQVSQQSDTPIRETVEEKALLKFVGQVLATTETCWQDLLPRHFNRKYEDPSLVVFRDGVRSACGEASSSMGPFYCPGDHNVYIDLSFLDKMGQMLGAKGDFAQAYVVAHEVGHHVQNLLGTSDKVHRLHSQLDETEYNKYSVRLELQADYFAGVWAHYVEHKMGDTVKLEAGDYEEAINAAHSVGDDTLQKRASGRVVPEKFTHGTAAQRAKWFKLGYDTGDPTAHDPFQEEK